MEVCLNLNHRLANSNLAQRNLVPPDIFFAALTEKLAVTRSRDTERGYWWHDECRSESSAIFLVRSANSKRKLTFQTFSGILKLLKNMCFVKKTGATALRTSQNNYQDGKMSSGCIGEFSCISVAGRRPLSKLAIGSREYLS